MRLNDKGVLVDQQPANDYVAVYKYAGSDNKWIPPIDLRGLFAKYDPVVVELTMTCWPIGADMTIWPLWDGNFGYWESHLGTLGGHLTNLDIIKRTYADNPLPGNGVYHFGWRVDLDHSPVTFKFTIPQTPYPMMRVEVHGKRYGTMYEPVFGLIASDSKVPVIPNFSVIATNIEVRTMATCIPRRG